MLYTLYVVAGIGAALVYSGCMGSALKWFTERARARGRHHRGGLRRRHGALHSVHRLDDSASAATRRRSSTTGIFQGVVILIVAQFLRHPPRAAAAGGVGQESAGARPPSLHDRRDAAHAAVLRAVRDVRDDGDRRSAGDRQRRTDGRVVGHSRRRAGRWRPRSTRSPTAAAGSSGAGRRIGSAASWRWASRSRCRRSASCWSLTVGQLSGTLFAVTLVAHLLHVGRDLLAVPVARRRLLRHAVRHLELRRAVHGEGRRVDHRRRRRGGALRAVRHLVRLLLRQRSAGAPRRRHGIRPSQLAWPAGASTRRGSDREIIRRCPRRSMPAS